MKDLAKYQKALGQAITTRREKLGFTREKLARITGTSIDDIVSIEEGIKESELSEMLLIALALGIPLSTLLSLAEVAITEM